MKGNNRELKPLLDMLTAMLNDAHNPKGIKIFLHCPYCDTKGSGTANNNYIPKEGDPTICPHCFNMLCFNEEMELVKFTPEAWQALGEKVQRKLKIHQQEVIERESKHGQE